MSQALAPSMSLEEFLAWEENQERKWEFDGYSPVAMVGASDAHSAIQINLVVALQTRLRGSKCHVRGPETKIRIGSKIRYPDALVSCTAVAPTATIAVDPVVIFEILSKTTQRTDRTTKLLEYRSLDSVQRYVLIEQDQAMATSYSRTGQGWIVNQFLAADTLPLPEIGIEIPIAELYADVELPKEEA